uniref:AC5 protein n=1 Tax=Tomato leaf curl New Delhi virus TaxID=223347 RepID=A0A2L2BMD3_9GEMI|nr:AC5 protein [Tomato leaf curl New Delhi virus]
MHVLHRCCARFIVKHVKHFPKILRRSCRTTITDQKKHNTVRMILGLDVLIHPYLPKHIDGFHTESLSYAMCESGSSGNVANALDLANMRRHRAWIQRIAPYKGLHSPLARRDFIRSVNSGFSVHRPVGPGLCFCGAGNGDNCTSSIGAAEVETTAYFRSGR